MNRSGILRSLLNRYLSTMILARRRSLFENMAYRAAAAFFPGAMRKQRRRYARIADCRRVSIVSPDDNQLDMARRLLSGDYWARYELTKALGRLGYCVTNLKPDVVIHLFGTPAPLPSDAYKIAWIYSHPEQVTPSALRQYDRIFCISSSFTQKIRDMGFEAVWMPAATAKTPLHNPVKYDVVFVGNTRRGTPRQIVLDLGDTPHNLKVWGSGWHDILSSQHYGGEYFDYTELDRLYSSAWISLSDHRHEMRREGFVAIRVFDILGSGGFCISDSNCGIEELFGDSVPQYNSSSELQELVRYYIDHPDARRACMEKGQAIVANHTWPDRAKRLLHGIDPEYR